MSLTTRRKCARNVIQMKEAMARLLCQNSTLIVNLIFDNIRPLIEERVTMLSKMSLLFRSSFFSRIQQKSRGTDIFGLCFVNVT